MELFRKNNIQFEINMAKMVKPDIQNRYAKG
jgi:hypothetical protein